MVNLFSPVDFEIHSNRSAKHVIDDLKERATFNDNAFKIISGPFSFFWGTKVTGRVIGIDNKTKVQIKISPSPRFKAGLFLMVATTLVFPTMFFVRLVKEGSIDYKLVFFGILGYLGGLIVLLFVLKLMLRFVIWMEKESLFARLK